MTLSRAEHQTVTDFGGGGYGTVPYGDKPMARTLTYSERSTVSLTVAENVEAALKNWHDPANDQWMRHVRLQPESEIDENGNEVPATDGQGNPLYQTSVAAEKVAVPEQDIGTEKDNMVTSVNNGLPADWPQTSEAEIGIS